MQAEADRRQNLVDDLATREKRLNAFFKGDITEAEPSRYHTFQIEMFILLHKVYLLKQVKSFFTRCKTKVRVKGILIVRLCYGGTAEVMGWQKVKKSTKKLHYKYCDCQNIW